MTTWANENLEVTTKLQNKIAMNWQISSNMNVQNHWKESVECKAKKKWNKEDKIKELRNMCQCKEWQS